MRVCDQLTTIFGSKAGGRLVLPVFACRDSSNLSASCFRRPKKSCELVADPHELAESHVGKQVCDLDSVIEFGLKHVRAISACRDSLSLVVDLFAAGLRPAFDRPATHTRFAHAGLRPGRPYASQYIWCLSQTRINWDGCGRKVISLNSWSRYKSALLTLFILLLGACHILIYCSSLNLPPLNPDMTNFQGHSLKISITHPLPSIIYFPSTSCIGSEQPHGSHVLSHAPKILFLY